MNEFERNIVRIYREKGKTWLANVQEQVQHFEKLWGLSHLKSFENLSYHYVLSGYQGKTPIVLKLSLDPHGLENEKNALEGFAERGAVAVLNQQDGALLLQRANPGCPLKGASDAIRIACDVMKKLHTAPSPKAGCFPNIKEWLSTLDKDWDLPEAHLHRARTLKDQLLPTLTSSTLLHGDLHQGNILSNNKDWLVIDPKGIIGSPINEIWAFVEKPDSDLKYISKYFNFELNTVIHWYYIHLILAACWQVEDNLDPQRFLNLAEYLNCVRAK